MAKSVLILHLVIGFANCSARCSRFVAVEGKVLSVHAVKRGRGARSYRPHGLVAPGAPQGLCGNPQGAAVIFHWFSGSGSSLRAPSDAAAIFPSILACAFLAARMYQPSLKRIALKATCRPPRCRIQQRSGVRAAGSVPRAYGGLHRCRLDSLKEKVAAGSRALLEG